MNTPAHMLINAALFGRPSDSRVTIAAAVGGLAPDLPAIVMVMWALRVSGDTPDHVFGTLYFSDSWQAIMAPTHAFPLWGAAVILALWLRAPMAQAFFASGLFHSICDFFLHHDDPHRHFWPLSDWRFASPVSYWDPAHYGDVFQFVELGLVALAIVHLLVRHPSTMVRIAVGVSATAIAVQTVTFMLMFGGS
jgi:hypothetical protein